MNTTVDLTQGAELHVGGATVGVFLPETKLRELVAERDALRGELEEARRRIVTLEAECNRYSKALARAVQDQFPPLDDETALARIAEAESNGVDLAVVIREVEEILYKEGGEGHHAS